MSDTAFVAYNNALKIYYNGQQIQDLTNTDNPWLAMLPRRTLKGQSMPLPVIESYGQGVSAVYATAVTNATLGNPLKFVLQPNQLYRVIVIDRMTWKASQGDNASFMDYMKFMIDGGIQTAANALAAYAFRNGSGVLAQASGTISSGLVTLVDPDNATYFEVGQVLDASTVDGGTGTVSPNRTVDNLIGSPTPGYVIAVDYAAGTLTLSTMAGGSAGTPSGWTASGLYLLLDGTANAVGTGLSGWVPFTAPGSSDSFMNVNRSVDPSRLAGSRIDQSTGPTVEEAFLNASSLLARMGKKPDAGVVSTNVYNQLIKTLQGRIVFVDAKVGQVGFEGVKVNGAKGPISVFQDRNCPQQFGWLLTTKNWGLYSISGAPELQVDDFGRLLRLATADAYQAVVSAYYEFGCDAPVGQCIIKFATPS